MNDDKPETNKSVILIVISTLALNSTIGVATLAYCLSSGRDLKEGILTAFVGIVTGCLGWIGGTLSKTSPSETTKQLTVQSQPVVLNDTTPKV